MGERGKCSKETEFRLIDGLCSICAKVKAKTVIVMPSSNF